MSNKQIRPNYYKGKYGSEVVKIIQEFELNFTLGSALKYILRAGKKVEEDKAKDLKKAITCIQLELDDIELDNERNR